MPLVGALAAGNCVLLKPSSYAPNVSAALKRLLSCFPSGLVQVVEGGRAENQALLKAPFDFIFFTGGSYVGRQVLHAAADNLVPCVLELGGKSPCLVLEDADIELTARRLIYGKVLNTGQTCVAPDYVLVQKGAHDALLAALERQAKALCPQAPRGPAVSQDHQPQAFSAPDGPVAGPHPHRRPIRCAKPEDRAQRHRPRRRGAPRHAGGNLRSHPAGPTGGQPG